VHRLLYLVLGAPDSGRLAIIQDLIDGGLTEEESAQILTNAESPDMEGCASWHWENGSFHIPESANIAQTTHQFLIFSPYLDLADQIEASTDLLDSDDQLTLARVLFVVHCGLLEKTAPLLQEWHDACAHFADVMLLNRREGVTQKPIEKFNDRYKSMRFPFLVEFVRKDRIANPAKILDPTPRRITQIFDPEEELESDFSDLYIERLSTGERGRKIPLPFGETS
tara:strand:+ start:596 stop:1270 length:675 start_codon:yes stop_codon:yes gene_type:complete